jgi:hypothetical protein
MGKPQIPSKALLFAGILYSSEHWYLKALELLTEKFGEIAMYSPPIIWDFSDYYKDELGEQIIRRFVFFKNLIEQDELPEIKTITNRFEELLSSNNKRNVNLDPGYLTPAKIVLASTKDYSHRIYLKGGIFAEVSLIYKKNSFVPHLNTYKDFQDQRYLEIFISARRLLKIINKAG